MAIKFNTGIHLPTFLWIYYLHIKESFPYITYTYHLLWRGNKAGRLTFFFKLFFRNFFLFLTNSYLTCHFEISSRLKIGLMYMKYTAIPNRGLRHLLFPRLHSLGYHSLNLYHTSFVLFLCLSVCLSVWLAGWLAGSFFLSLHFPFFIFLLLYPSHCKSTIHFECTNLPFVPH